MAELDLLAAERGLPPSLAEPLRSQLRDRLLHAERSSDGDATHEAFARLHNEIERLLIAAERERANDLFCDNRLTDEARRRIERELDLRETYLDNQRGQA